MDKAIEITAGDFVALGLVPCGSYFGEFQEESYKILGTQFPDGETEEWADIMLDKDGVLYAAWGEKMEGDGLIARIYHNDCPAAFRAAEDKLEIIRHEKEEEQERREDEKRDRCEL